MAEEIEIAGRLYDFTETILSPNHLLVKLISDEGKSYELNSRSGAWTCDCPDSIYRRPHDNCKHVWAFRRRAQAQKQEQPMSEPNSGTLTAPSAPVPTLTKAQANNIAKPQTAPIPAGAEKALIQGDLSGLSDTERLAYYRSVCESLGLNPLTQPFGYLTFNKQLQLYAKRNCTDQLRMLHRISVRKTGQHVEDGILTIEVEVTAGDGRVDSDIGCVAIGALKGPDLANAHMKCLTKAKRRATLSICGLSWMDESELETLPESGRPTTNLTPGSTPAPAAPQKPAKRTEATNGQELIGWLDDLDAWAVKQNLGDAGDVREAVVVWAMSNRWPEDWTAWDESQIRLAMSQAKHVVAEMQARKKAETAA